MREEWRRRGEGEVEEKEEVEEEVGRGGEVGGEEVVLTCRSF